jgi:hypothetical protein
VQLGELQDQCCNRSCGAPDKGHYEGVPGHFARWEEVPQSEDEDPWTACQEANGMESGRRITLDNCHCTQIEREIYP